MQEEHYFLSYAKKEFDEFKVVETNNLSKLTTSTRSNVLTSSSSYKVLPSSVFDRNKDKDFDSSEHEARLLSFNDLLNKIIGSSLILNTKVSQGNVLPSRILSNESPFTNEKEPELQAKVNDEDGTYNIQNHIFLSLGSLFL